MGFRSTFTTDDYPIRWPDWFREKYEESVHVPETGHLCSKFEAKVHVPWADLVEDIRKAMPWEEYSKRKYEMRFVLLWLHDCGGVTKVVVTKDWIKYFEAEEWEETGRITHHGGHCRLDCVLPYERPQPMTTERMEEIREANRGKYENLS